MPISVPKIKDNPTIPPEMRRAFSQGTHANAVAAAAAPTMAEFNALVTNYNALLAKLRLAGIVD